MKTQRIVGIVGLSMLVAGGALAQERAKRFSSEKLLADVGKQLDLVGQELDGLKPALEKKSEEFTALIDSSVDQGFVQMGEFADQAKAKAKELEAELDGVLSAPQIQELKSFLENMDEGAIESVLDELTNKMAKELDVTKDQLAKLRPALRKEVEGIGKLLDESLKKGAASLSAFEAGSDKLWKELRAEMDGLLSDVQMGKADALRSERTEKMSKLFEALPETPVNLRN